MNIELTRESAINSELSSHKETTFITRHSSLRPKKREERMEKREGALMEKRTESKVGSTERREKRAK